ncbi:hypothetical protein RJ640_018217 [Escallonia rubra]|uniref:Alpha/beta hydrolase fold-3 domain-containing protein n=1 Tax=Escallonia rubra TaxID=112253 RepID=A0AA88U5P8_9ASTE|nr:hypothetical protein RJ640_018217 [Escallonia rubra]
MTPGTPSSGLPQKLILAITKDRSRSTWISTVYSLLETVRTGSEKLKGIKLAGIVLVHPFLWAEKPLSSKSSKAKTDVEKLWRFVSPSTRGLTDPRINPAMDRRLSKLGCNRVLVCIAGKDLVAEGNYGYVRALHSSGWKEVLEIMVQKDMGHDFHLNPKYGRRPEAKAMLKRVASLIMQNKAKDPA